MGFFKSLLLFALLAQDAPSPEQALSPAAALPLDKIIAAIENNSSCKWQKRKERNQDEGYYCDVPLGSVQFRMDLYRNATLSYFITREKKSGIALSLFKFEGDAGITARIIYDGGGAGEFDGVPDKVILKQVFLRDLTRTLLEGSEAVDSSFTHPVEEYELALYQAILGGFAKK